jgi:hypothetical protein
MKHCSRQLVWLIGCALAVACSCSRVCAQVVVLRVEPEAEPVCREIEAALVDFSPSKDPGYFAEARREGLDPTSEDALLRLIPALRAKLVVVALSAGANGGSVDLRDGKTGASVGVVSIGIVDGQLDWSPLREEVANRLRGPASANAESVSDSAGEYPALHVRVSGGVGLGSRDVSWPMSGETWSVDTGMFAAFDLTASFHVAVASAFALGLDLSYQTSAAAQIDEMHRAGATEQLGIRANQLAAMFAFAIGGPSITITPALGYETRGLRPAVHHLLTPSYSLAGPAARLGARFAFTDAFSLRVVPELQYVFVGDALREQGVSQTGLAVGGEVALELAVSDAISIELSGRMAHAWMSTTSDASATDTERFATARLVWQP